MKCPTRSPVCIVTQRPARGAVLIGRAAWQIRPLNLLYTAYRSLDGPTALGRCKWLSRIQTQLYRSSEVRVDVDW